MDDIEVRRLKLGEDRESYISAPGVVLVSGVLVVSFAIGSLLYSNADPSIWAYAFPLVLLRQILQMTLRLVFQRTQAKTLGIVVRPALRPGPIAVRYDDIIAGTLHDERFWTTIRLVSTTSGPVTFRIFRFSVPSLEQILRSSTTASIHRKPLTTA
ncbi:MAG: hypothetical protein IPP80_10840 [Ignavibacteria bacterium]|nr:hypothetical protein [Ignavibacteria bacterium]